MGKVKKTLFQKKATMKTLILWLFFATTAFSQHGEMQRLMQKFDVTVDSTASIANPSAVRCERWYTHKTLVATDTMLLCSVSENGGLYMRSILTLPRKRGHFFHVTACVTISTKSGAHTYTLSEYGSAHPYNSRSVTKEKLRESIAFYHHVDHAWLQAIAVEDSHSVVFTFVNVKGEKITKVLSPREIKALKETYHFLELSKIKRT